MYLFVFCFLVHQMSETFLPIFSKRTRFPNHAYVSLMVEKKNVWHVLDWLNLLFKGCYMSNLLFSSTNYKQVKHLLASSFWVNGCPSCLVWWNLPSTSYERPLLNLCQVLPVFWTFAIAAKVHDNHEKHHSSWEIFFNVGIVYINMI